MDIEPRSFSLSYPGAPLVYKGKESALEIHTRYTHTHTHIDTRREGLYIERSKPHNDKPKDLYYSPNIVRVIKLRRILRAGHVARMGESKGIYRVLVGQPEGKSPLGRTRRRWEENNKMDLQDVGCGGMD
jgi:hypothetical protein